MTPGEIYPITVESQFVGLSQVCSEPERRGPMYSSGPGVKAVNRIYVGSGSPIGCFDACSVSTRRYSKGIADVLHPKEVSFTLFHTNLPRDNVTTKGENQISFVCIILRSPLLTSKISEFKITDRAPNLSFFINRLNRSTGDGVEGSVYDLRDR